MHPVSRAFMDFFRDGDLPYRRLVVDDHIVDETATRLEKQASMRQAAAFLTTLGESSLYQFECVSADVFEEARETFADWTDQDASFTDCVVSAHMADLELDHILTYDQHYDASSTGGDRSRLRGSPSSGHVTTLPYRSQD